MKKAAIVCDNYKLEKFEQELNAKEFSYKVTTYTPDTSLIAVTVEDDQIKEVGKITQEVEAFFNSHLNN